MGEFLENVGSDDAGDVSPTLRLRTGLERAIDQMTSSAPPFSFGGDPDEDDDGLELDGDDFEDESYNAAAITDLSDEDEVLFEGIAAVPAQTVEAAPSAPTRNEGAGWLDFLPSTGRGDAAGPVPADL